VRKATSGWAPTTASGSTRRPSGDIDFPRAGEQLRAGHLHRGRRSALVHDRLQVPGGPVAVIWASCATILMGRLGPSGNAGDTVQPGIRLRNRSDDGSIWVGFWENAGGLMRFDPGASQWTSYATAQDQDRRRSLLRPGHNLVFPEYTWGWHPVHRRQFYHYSADDEDPCFKSRCITRGRARARRDLYAGATTTSRRARGASPRW